MLIAVIISAAVAFVLVGLVTRLTPWWGAILFSVPLSIVIALAAAIAVAVMDDTATGVAGAAAATAFVAGLWATVRYARRSPNGQRDRRDW